MKTIISRQLSRLLLVIISSFYLTACVGTVVGAVVDTAVEVVKVPFKVGGAVIDAVTPDDFSDNLRDPDKDGKPGIDSDAAAVEMESDAL